VRDGDDDVDGCEDVEKDLVVDTTMDGLEGPRRTVTR
jgi:hypothetical protein